MNLKQIKKSNAMQLCGRITRLQFDEEAGCNIPGDKEEIELIGKELKGRIIKILGRDFYPPLLNPKPKLGAKIKFKITVTSSIGSKVAEKSVEVDSNGEANKAALKMIRELGLKKATYKIS